MKKRVRCGRTEWYERGARWIRSYLTKSPLQVSPGCMTLDKVQSYVERPMTTIMGVTATNNVLCRRFRVCRLPRLQYARHGTMFCVVVTIPRNKDPSFAAHAKYQYDILAAAVRKACCMPYLPAKRSRISELRPMTVNDYFCSNARAPRQSSITSASPSAAVEHAAGIPVHLYASPPPVPVRTPKYPSAAQTPYLSPG